MSALVPVVLLCGALTAKVAGDANGADEPEAGTPDSSVSSTPTAPAPAPAETAGGGVQPAEAEPSTIATILPTLSALLPTSTAPKPVKPATVKTPAPSKPSSSTPAPTNGPTSGPTATPTPEEAEQQCLGEGVNPLDLAALARCIAEKLAG